MKILVDENIPYAEQLFSKFGEVKVVSGRSISSSQIKQSDALIVRSVTQVNKLLLKGSNIKFVGTATAGFDHIDRKWLEKEGISFSFAPGCNAVSVVEYVFSSLLFLAERDGFDLREKIVGIIGVGNIGNCLKDRLRDWGVTTLLCDPPRLEGGDNTEKFLSLEKLVRKADILTFHTSLNRIGPNSSYHLLNEELLSTVPSDCILVNTSRGSVFDNQALLKSLKNGKKIDIILDVWECEPFLSIPLLFQTSIGTPHIAGYSLEGRVRGAIQVFTSFSKFLGKKQKISLTDLLPVAEFNEITFYGELTQMNLKRLVHLVYDVRRDDRLLKNLSDPVCEFDRLRQYYPERREWSSINVNCDNPDAAKTLKLLGFNTRLI